MTTRKILCLMLVFTQIGCRSVYRIHCTSDPAPAGVLAGEEFLGETECTVEIPSDSEWIENDQIELTFCLPNGAERKRVVELHGRKPSNPLAEFVSLPFMIGGAGLILMDDDDDEEEEYDAWSDSDEDDDVEELGLMGLGVVAIGAGLYCLFGGDFDSLNACPVHVDFNEPAPED